MGGCVVSLMEGRSRSTMVPDPIIQNYINYGPVNIRVPDSATHDSSEIMRNAGYVDDKEYEALCSDERAADSVTMRFSKTCAQNKDEKRIAYRPVEKVVKEMGYGGNANRPLMVTYLKETEYITLGQMWEYVEAFSRGLAELNLPPRSTVAIYEETRWEWLASIHGIWTRDLVASTVYANLGEDALFYALNETESKAIVCNAKNVPHLLRGVAAGAFPPCTIIYLDSLPADCAAPDSCRLVAWGDVVEMGRKAPEREIIMPKNEDLALIMYTSGTTGNPKGVMHTHNSMTCGMRAMELYLNSNLSSIPNEAYCAYLPLAHILEFGVVSVFLQRGALIGFGSPRTLTNVTARPHGDFQEYKPNVIVAVPRVFDTVRRGVEAKLPPPGSLKRQVFDAAYKARLDAMRAGMDTPFFNEKLFKQVRVAMGGRVMLMLSGGGPLSAATQEFINVVFGLLVNGWGLTETVCVGAIQRLGDLDTACAGQVLPLEELKLADTEDYKHTDLPEPRGELCIRGPFLFKGYYKQPELTKEALDDEGWFHTGDIGSIMADNRIRVIGRVKALAKNCLGEYIALETLESIYANHPLVLNNCVCVLVHPDKNYICALANTDEGKLFTFAKQHGIEHSGSVEELLKSAEFRAAVDKSFGETGYAARRRPFEIVRHVGFALEEWTPENGVLTAAMKLKRSVINARHASDIDALFIDP